MREISDSLLEAINSDSQIVKPVVTARFVDSRLLDNYKISSASELHDKQILRKSPKAFWRFSEKLDSATYSADSSGSGVTLTLSNAVSAASVLPNYQDIEVGVISDSFDRADSANDLGVTDGGTGDMYKVVGDGIFGISSNCAYISDYKNWGTAEKPFALVDSGGNNGYVQFKYGAAPTLQQGLVARYVDNNNFVMAYMANFIFNFFAIIKVVNGVASTVSSAIVGASSGDTVKFSFTDHSYVIYKNGTSIVTGTITDAVFDTSTLHGFGHYSTATISGSKWNDFECFGWDYSDRSMSLTGATNKYAYATNLSPINIVNDMTLSFWIKPASVTGTQTIFSYEDGSSVKWKFYLDGTIARISFFSNYDDETPLGISHVDINEWSHFVITKNGSTLTGYKDGVEISTSGILAPIKDLSTGKFIIGGDTYSGGTVSNPYNGFVDEVAIFDKALTSKEVEMLYASVISNTSTYSAASTHFIAEQAFNQFEEESLAFVQIGGKSEYGTDITSSGSYAIIPTTPDINQEYGARSRGLSDAYGDFSNQEEFWIEFDELTINKFELSTGYILGKLKEFTIYYRDTDGVVTSIDDYFDFDSSIKTVELDDEVSVNAIGIKMNSTWNPEDYGILYSLNPIFDKDISDYVISFSVNKIRDNYDSTLPIGLTSANTGNIVLDNTDQVFNIYDPTSLYGKYLQPEIKIFLSLSWQTEQNDSEILKIYDGLYIDEWSVDSGMTVSGSARDWSKYLQEETKNAGQIFERTTAGAAIAKLMLMSGFPSRKISFYDTFHKAIASTRPYALWRFNDTDSTLVDFGGNYNGTYTGSPSQGKAGIIDNEVNQIKYDVNRVDTTSIIPFDKKSIYSTLFPGTNGVYASVTDASSLISFSGEWSVAAVFKPEGLPANIGDTSFVVSKYNSGAAKYNYAIGIKKTDTDEYKVVGVTNTPTSQYVVQSSALAYSDLYEQLLFVAFTKDDLTLSLYLNGELVGSDTADSYTSYTTTSDLVFADNNTASSGGEFNGYIGAASIWNRPLSSSEVERLYNCMNVDSLYIFEYLYFVDSTIWDAILEFATADVGMFYFDEDETFRYEYAKIFHDGFFNKFSTSQFDISDDDFIISGSYKHEIQANSIIVNVNPIVTVSRNYQEIWRANEGASLAVTKITEDMTPDQTSVTVYSTDSPVWFPTGYLKVGDEIMSYSGKTGSSLTGLERGLFGTSREEHSNNDLCREVRVFDIEYTNKPTANVKSPFITAISFDKTADLESFVSTGYGCRIILSANENNAFGDLVVLEGKNPVTELENYFALAGIVIEEKKTSEKIEKKIVDLASNRRKFRKKEMTIDNKFIQDKAYAEKIAEFLINFFSLPVNIVSIESHCVPHLELGDLITITAFDQLGMSDVEFWVIENNISYDGGLHQSLTLREKKDGVV